MRDWWEGLGPGKGAGRVHSPLLSCQDWLLSGASPLPSVNGPSSSVQWVGVQWLGQKSCPGSREGGDSGKVSRPILPL